MEKVTVIIVGAGPAGLATSACLNLQSIPNIILEREDCSASLWKKRAYDRLKLHLAKEYCQLPHMPFPSYYPTFVPKNDFINYLENYIAHFKISPKYHRSVEFAVYDEKDEKWCLHMKNSLSNANESYSAKYLVVATGENGEGIIPQLPGLYSFDGEIIHSNQYINGQKYTGKKVLVVGCGNSGMEIAYDLSNWGANTSIIARSPVHILNEGIIYLGMRLMNYLPCGVVDSIVVNLGKLKYGDLSKYGLQTPSQGPFYLKMTTGRSPTIDVGAVEKIKLGDIKVHKSITSIERNTIKFASGDVNDFDAIILATGYYSTVNKWLKDGQFLFNEVGMPKLNPPNHWKGKNGIYCVGFARKGLEGISMDAQNIAKDINYQLFKN